MKKRKLRLRFSCPTYLILFLSILLPGCNTGMSGLTGTVTFSDDGTPLTSGEVRFETDKYLARGHLDENGRYTISSTENLKGLPPGRYRVCIVGAVKPIGKDDSNMDILESLINPKYASVVTSGLEFEVKDKSSRYDIKVDRFKK